MVWSSSPTPKTSAAGPGGEPHEQDVGGREVLQLVDEEVAVVGLHRPPQLAVVEQRLERAEDLLVEVDGAPPAERLAVGLVGVGQAGDVVERVLHLLRVAQPEPDQRQAVEVRARSGRCSPGAAREGTSCSTMRPHLALVEQLRPAALGPAEDAVAPRVDRLDARAQAGQPGRHLLLGLLVVREGHDRLALVAAVGEEVAVPLGEDTRSSPSRRER